MARAAKHPEQLKKQAFKVENAGEATRVSLHRGMQNKVRPRNGLLCSSERKEIPTPATTWMNLEDIRLSKTSQSQKDRHCWIPRL